MSSIKMMAERAILPAHIWNHCQPVGRCTTWGGGSSTRADVWLRMRVSSSASTITWRARLSQVAVTSTESAEMRRTLSTACPLRLPKPVPIGIELSIRVSNVVAATLGGTGCWCRSTNLFTSSRLSVLLAVCVNRPGALQLAADRAISIMLAGRSLLDGAVEAPHGLVEFNVLIL